MRGDTYSYSIRMLKDIANSYGHIYQGIEIYWHSKKANIYRYTVTDPRQIAEFRADFDTALKNIGRGNWNGELKEFKYYRHYGRLQQIIIAGIIGIDDDELTRFYDIPRLQGYAYYLMCRYLNGG